MRKMKDKKTQKAEKRGFMNLQNILQKSKMQMIQNQNKKINIMKLMKS